MTGSAVKRLSSRWRQLFHRRQPVRFQLDSYDCGPACLEMILRHYGAKYQSDYIQDLCRMDRLGSSLGAMAKGAQTLNMKTLAVKLTYKELAEKALLPAIAFLTEGHYVVVERITPVKVYVADPSIGRLTFTRSEWEHAWLMEEQPRGVLLMLEPSIEGFPEAIGLDAKAISARDFLAPLWKESSNQFGALFGAAAVSLLIQSTLPMLSGSIVDAAIGHHNSGILELILVAEFALLTGRALVDVIQSWLIAYVGARCDLALVSRFLLKLTKLPIAFFDGKTAGDLLQRLSDQQLIEQFFTNSVSQLLLAAVSLAVFGIILGFASPLLFLVYLIGAGLYLSYSYFFFSYQRVLNYKSFRLSSRKQGVVMEMLAGMPEIKLNNAGEYKHDEWRRTQSELSYINVRTRLLGAVRTSGGIFISQLTTLALVTLSAIDVMHGRLTLGEMVAVQFMVGQLNWPLQQIIDVSVRSQDALMSYERTKQIFDMRSEKEVGAETALSERPKLSLTNVSFDYGGTRRDRVLSDIDLHIPYGTTVAVVGRSGSGKTTLLKLLLQFYQPTGGSIAVGSRDLSEIPPDRWHELCGTVLQDGYIFSDSLVRNIAIGAAEIDLVRVWEVVRVAQLTEFVNQLPQGLKTRIGNDGIGISRGQAQRVMIARALYRDPQFLFMDEATSALDAETEAAFVKELGTILSGRTAILIAHRMSTVRHADLIVVLESGRIVEVGKHDELVSKQGKYYSLIQNQLELEA